MALGCSRDVGAAERERGVNRLSLRWVRSWCCSILLSVKRVSSLLPEAKQSIPRWEAEVTVQHVTSHFIFRCILLLSGVPGWIRRSTSLNPLPQMAIAIRNSLNKLRKAKGEPSHGA